MRRWSLLLGVALVLAQAAAPWRLDAAKEVRYVSVTDTRLLARPMAFSPALATLDAGDAVTVLGQSGNYLQVEVRGRTGFLPARAVQADRPAIGYSRRRTTDASSEEIAAATKGFSSEVEAEYRRDNPRLDYGLLDRLEARSGYRDPIAELAAFRREGKLGEHAEGRR
jgi:hypothetical protein